jgi:hypothetical protein
MPLWLLLPAMLVIALLMVRGIALMRSETRIYSGAWARYVEAFTVALGQSPVVKAPRRY